MSDYRIEGGVLSVAEDLRQEFDTLFDQACQKLVESEEESLLIDLSRIRYVNSTCIGMIAATFFQAKTRKKSLSIRAHSGVLQVFRAAGFEGFIHLEEA